MLPSAPDWVSFEADQTEGLDLLGLRAPVQAIGAELFNGVTTVTPKLRYMSLLTWIIWRYSQARLPEAWTPFEEFASAQEAAIVMANLIHDRNTIALVGANEARKRVDKQQKTLPLSQLVQNIAFNIYVTSSRQLNLTHLRDSGFSGLVEDRGLKLARAFDRVICKYDYGNRLAKRPIFDRVPRSELDELSRHVLLDHIPAEERAILIDALMPVHPEDDEWQRLRTYALLLWLSKKEGKTIEEDDLFAAALKLPPELPVCMRTILDDWLKYIIRDSLAVTHEAVFEAVMHEVDAKTAARGAPARAEDVVAAILSAEEEHEEVLREFGLLKKAEKIRGLTFDRLRQRIESRCHDQQAMSNGLRRWRGGLREIELYEAALDARKGAAALLPVVWCLAVYRVHGDEPESQSTPDDILQTGGIYQIGLGEVVIPKVEQFTRENRPVLEVMSELIVRTVQQHLRIAWSRFMAPNGKDVSVLVADTDEWSRNGNNGFQAGRTDSRLWVAISWLEQLDLTDDDGLTSAGERLLDRCLTTLGGNA
jgi:hypothetical protein